MDVDASRHSITPPPLQGPTAKEKKYDRQLRLWAAAGQQALEEAHILLLNNGSGVVGTETLKNLILPGIGSFTIVDERPVREPDLGVNFFLEESSLGKSRAEETCKFLNELNPEVKGHAVNMYAGDFIEKEDLSKYTLVILTSPVSITGVVQKVVDVTWKHQIPLFWVQCLGFYSCFNVQLPEYFPIVETHPDPVSTEDLRLLNPWPALIEHVKLKTSFLDDMSDHDHGHVPYLVLLLHYLQKWKAEHGQYPDKFSEKKEFRALVQAGARTSNPEGGEENFDEAVAAVLKSVNPPSISSGLREVFEDVQCKEPNQESPNFFLIAHAIQKFYASTGTLPLPGSVPDMKAQSADYIALQNLYRSKSQADIKAVTETIRSLEMQLSRPRPIADKEIEAFCKGASWVKLLRGCRISLPQLEPDGPEAGAVPWPEADGTLKRAKRELLDPSSKMHIYLAMLGFGIVYTEEDAWARSHKPGDFYTERAKISSYWALGEDGQAKTWVPRDPPENAFDRIAQGEAMHPGVRREEIDDYLTTRDYGDAGGYMRRVIRAAAVQSAGRLVVPPKQDDEAQAEERKEVVARVYKVAEEIARSGPGENHNIASLTGGMVAQEVIKVVTKQYVPVDNTCIFDGITSESRVIRL